MGGVVFGLKEVTLPAASMATLRRCGGIAFGGADQAKEVRMRFSHAASAATALGLLVSLSGVMPALAANSYNVSGPASGSNVVPSTAVEKSAAQEKVSMDKADYLRHPQNIGTPAAIGAPGATAMRGTEGGPSLRSPRNSPRNG